MKNHYHYLRINEKRKKIDQIQIATSSFLRLFDKQDQPFILKGLYSFYVLSEFAVFFFTTAFFFGVCSLNFHVHLFLILAFLSLSLIKTDFSRLKSYREHLAFLPIFSEKYNMRCYQKWIVRFGNRHLLFQNIFPYILGQCLYATFHEDLPSTLRFSFSSSVILYILFFLFYYFYNMPNAFFRRKKENHSTLRILLTRSEKTEQTKKYTENSFGFLIQRELDLHFKTNLFKILSILLLILIFTGFFLLKEHHPQTIPIFFLVLWATLPVVLYGLTFSLLYKNLFDQDYVTATYYLEKKWNCSAEITLSLTILTIKNARFYLLPLTGLIFLSFGDRTQLLCTLLCLIHCVVILMLLALRMHKYTAVSFDLLHSNILVKIISNPYEDYILLGLPMITLSLNIVNYLKIGHLSSFLLSYFLFMLLVILYTGFKLKKARLQTSQFRL